MSSNRGTKLIGRRSTGIGQSNASNGQSHGKYTKRKLISLNAQKHTAVAEQTEQSESRHLKQQQDSRTINRVISDSSLVNSMQSQLTLLASDNDVKGRMVVFNAGEKSHEFVPPSDCKTLIIEMWGAGGGGSDYDANNKMPGGGGGAGGYVKCCIARHKISDSLFIKVGKGGTFGQDGGNTEVTDSSSTFAFSACGGKAATSFEGGKPGTCFVIGPVDSKISVFGQPGRSSEQSRGGDGGSSPFGGPGGYGSVDGFGGIIPGGGGGGAGDNVRIIIVFFSYR
jgi:hypothetical protein